MFNMLPCWPKSGPIKIKYLVVIYQLHRVQLCFSFKQQEHWSIGGCWFIITALITIIMQFEMGFQLQRWDFTWRACRSHVQMGLKILMCYTYIWYRQERPQMFGPAMPYIPVYLQVWSHSDSLESCYNICDTVPWLHLGMTPPRTTWCWQHDSNEDWCQDSMKVSWERDKTRNKWGNKGKKEGTKQRNNTWQLLVLSRPYNWNYIHTQL